MEALHGLWTDAGLEEIETRAITVGLTPFNFAVCRIEYIAADGRMPEPPMNFWPGARAPASRRSALCSRCARLTFGARPLLSGATLAVAAGDRNCLVRRNGIVSCG